MGIHETAVVHADAQLGDVEIGPYAIVGAGVQLADGVRVGPHSVIHGPTTVGAGTVLHAHVVLGDAPQDRKHDPDAPTRLVVGARNEEQLRANLAATQIQLDPEHIDRLDTVSRRHPVYPYWHQMDFDRNPKPTSW